MREILFRAKEHFGNKEWIYSDTIKKCGLDESIQCIIKEKIRFYQICDFDGEWGLVEDGTLGQYTGVDDKNDNKIFEDDILRIITQDSYSSTVGQVIFKDGAFLVRMADGIFMDLVPEENDYIWELEGNVHDNPGLIT